jgi:putative ABC transport system permease protein
MDAVGSVEQYAAARGRALDLVGEGEPERVSVAEVSPSYFRVFGITPTLGAGFTPADHQVENARVVLVSDGLWRRRWGGDPEVVGSTFLASDGRSPDLLTYTVVGVLPPGFVHPVSLENPFSRLPASEVWAPLPINSGVYSSSRTNYGIRAVARLNTGATLDVLNSELEILGVALTEAYPYAHVRGDTYRGLGARPLLDQVVGGRKSDLFILLGATGLLLLIACANVAGLLLARALDRSRELGLRAALGAGSARLFRLLVTESLLLSLLGGALGIGVAFIGVHAFRTFGPADFPRIADVALNVRVVAFGIGVAVVTGLLFGIGPALAGSMKKDGSTLIRGVRGGIASAGTGRLRSSIVTLEVALALVLLAGCGLLARSVLHLQSMDPGVDTRDIALVQVRLLPSYDSDEKKNAFFRDLRDNLEGLPGVLSATFIGDPPMGFNNWAPFVWRESDVLNGERAGSAGAHPVGLDYFVTMGIPILRGRGFTGADNSAATLVMVVSKTMAEDLWPGEDPLGKTLNILMGNEGPWITVVGVSGDIRQNSLASDPGWDVYLPYAQSSGGAGLFMAVRTAGNPLVLARAFRDAVWGLDANVPVPEITTMEARRNATLSLPRFRVLLLTAFAAVALLLASAGIYGTLMYSVGLRTSEMGIRMTLGARPEEVVRLVLRQGLRPVILGVVVGSAAALAATRLLESILFEIPANDPLTYVVVAVALVGVSLMACYVPARRASHIDPQEALRAD